MDMDEGYNISVFMPGLFSFGDDGGGRFLFYSKGNNGYGVYMTGYGNIDISDSIWI